MGEFIAFRLTGGQTGEFVETLPLLAGRQAKIVMADRGYNSSAIVATIEAIGTETVIPSKMYCKVQRPHDRTVDKPRKLVKRSSTASSTSANSPPGTANDLSTFRLPSLSPAHGYTWSDQSIPAYVFRFGN